MMSFLCAVLLYGAVVIITKTNGGCPIGGTYENNTMRRCDGSYKSGINVYVDFYQIKQPCTCTIKALFNGNLLVRAESAGYFECKNKVTVSLDTISVFTCDSTYPSSIVFTVENNETIVNMKAEYIQSYTSGDFPVCFGINENKELTTNTNHLSDRITSRSISTPKSTCTSDANNLALQITLACFVVISVVLAVLSVYLYIQLKFRIQSVNEKGNICSIDSQRTRSGTITDNYTELGLENVTTEPENQYESLARQENYKNLNMA
uniref:Uncharacterized protein LOC111105461 isoform X3 n=1 Tax=Crassostrea virginica TaxID=6565 RepID=A0A8B8AW27_CRAVI|nr:uncharacterized protein LOC111105461 isoform X3 [Crassostrea virginica]